MGSVQRQFLKIWRCLRAILPLPPPSLDLCWCGCSWFLQWTVVLWLRLPTSGATGGGTLDVPAIIIIPPPKAQFCCLVTLCLQHCHLVQLSTAMPGPVPTPWTKDGTGIFVRDMVPCQTVIALTLALSTALIPAYVEFVGDRANIV